ncbi:3-isopropylmalate dehydrogenase [Fusarium sp. NRRL 52700]|nr:3-isopropylmalate dehydrogenase [Fusarium sp. NRRL 52700]
MSESKVFRVLVLPGDHVGPEIMTEALKVLDIIETSRPDIRFERDTDIVGGCSIDKHGTPVTDAVLEKALASDAVLFGSIGGPEWAGVEPTPESGLLKLRQRLDAFANLRPCEILVPSLVSASPIKAELVAGTKFIVVRENCGGAYFGKKEESEDEASDLWIYSRPEVERLARVSAAVARILHASSEKANDGSKPVVWSADKANVLASGRLWRRATTDIFNKELTDIDLRYQLADSLAMLMVLDPKRFNNSVIHTDNTFGDVLSDISGGITGTLGVLPSASLAGVPGEGSCKGIYEPVHGSAPDISGKNLANPVAQILSLAMMLRYSFLLEKEADAIEQSVAKVLDTKEGGGLEIRTKDLGERINDAYVGLSFDGGYGQYVVTPQKILVKIPDGIAFAQAAVATDALATSYHAVVGFTVYGFDLNEDKFAQSKGYGAKDCFTSLDDATNAGLAFDVVGDFFGHSTITQLRSGL